jgi:hypothetical protein
MEEKCFKKLLECSKIFGPTPRKSEEKGKQYNVVL